MESKLSTKKKLGFLAVMLTLIAITILVAAAPAMANTNATQTMTFNSEGTTLATCYN